MNEKTERLEMRVSPDFLAKIDDWRRIQPDLPARAQAIRRLVEIGLEYSDTMSKPKKKR